MKYCNAVGFLIDHGVDINKQSNTQLTAAQISIELNDEVSFSQRENLANSAAEERLQRELPGNPQTKEHLPQQEFA